MITKHELTCEKSSNIREDSINVASETFPLRQLPEDTIVEVGNQSTTKDLSNLSKTNMSLHSLFKKNILVRHLLDAVVHGDQETAERILRKYPKLMTVKGQVTDYSGRVFFNVSAFEYMIWARDTRYMGSMMLRCLKENTDLTIDEQIVLAGELKKQHKKMQTEGQGISYILNGMKHLNENHFDINPLLTLLQTYINKDIGTYESLHELFIKGIGSQQWLLPAHAAQHYCDPNVPFSYFPKFKDEVFERCLDIDNWINNKPQKWWTKDNLLLGINFGITRGGWPKAHANIDYTWLEAAVDLLGFRALFEIRTLDCISLGDELETLIQNLGQAKVLSLCSAVSEEVRSGYSAPAA